MTDRQKRITAARAAVNTYLQQEEESAAQLAATVLPTQAEAGSLNFWGPSGRLEMMSMRRLIQMRAFVRLR